MPPYNDYGVGRALARNVDQFMGISRTLAAKPMLVEDDVCFLAKWLDQNRQVMDHPMIRPIADNIQANLLSPFKIKEIHGQLRALTGDVDGDGVPDGPTSIAYTNPPPKIVFPGKRFCFTGAFDFGQRWECELAVEDRGGICGNIAQSTDYLVIGSRVADSWKHSAFGTKINQAKAWQLAGTSKVKIVSEKHWVDSLNDADDETGAGNSAPQTPPNGGQASWPHEKTVFGRRQTPP